MKTVRLSSLFSCFLILGTLAITPSCKKKNDVSKQQMPQVTVEVTQPQVKDLPVYKEWVGSLTGKVNATIRAQVTGYLIEQTYHNGQVVKKGDVLFKIDPRPFQATLEQAEGSLAQARAARTKNQLDVERYTPLVETNAVSKKQLDDAIQATKEAEAAVEAAMAAVETAKLNLEFTVITSPIDGIAGIANAQIGDLVGQSGPVLTEVSSVNPIRVDFAINQDDWLNTSMARPKDDFSKISEDVSSVSSQLILSNNQNYEFPVIPVAINREVNTSTGSINIEAEVQNPSYLLRPGMYVRVKAQINTIKNALVVPTQAVVAQQNMYFVITVDDEGYPTAVPVKPGAVYEREQVITPLAEGAVTPQSKVVVVGTLRALMTAPRQPGEKAKEALKMMPYQPREPKALSPAKQQEKDKKEPEKDTVLGIIPKDVLI